MPAQEPARDRFIFHVYVDPNYGDDYYATLLNPSVNHPDFVGTSQEPKTGKPLQDHRQGPIFVPGFITHAPYAFKTVTQAIVYLNDAFRTPGPRTTPGLPVTYTVGTETRTVDYVVIHCAPGLYGPAFNPSRHAPSGLDFNGETFPIHVPERVSIQGTSALDTIFDARGDFVNVFMFDKSETQGDPDHYRYSFLDGVTIRGARWDGSDPPTGGQPTRYPTGAGVLVTNKKVEGNWIAQKGPAVSNCILLDNHVGIAVLDETFNPPLGHAPDYQVHIVSNTLVWNTVGIWNGGRYSEPGPSFYIRGWAKLCCANNAVDTTPPAGWTGLTPVSIAEGIDDPDLLVASVNGVTLATPAHFNAWRATFTIDGDSAVTTIIPGWWPTVRRSHPYPPPGLPPPLTAPRVDLDAWIGPATPQRGALYVADSLRLLEPANTTWQDRYHDLRLAPWATRAQGQGTAPNPLVNRGASGILGFVNGRELIPGLPLAAADIATFDAWDNDCEGHGNLRVFSRLDAGYTPNTDPLFGDIDIGADELGTLVMAGFAPSTRLHSRSVQGIHDGPAGDCTRIFFADVPGMHPRPMFNVWIGDGADPTQAVTFPHEWYSQLRNNPDRSTLIFQGSYTLSNYTDGLIVDGQGKPGWRYESLHNPQNFASPTPVLLNFPFMRNLVCDFSPHLLQDKHPGWGGHFTSVLMPQSYGVGVRSGKDPFACNPWYRSEDQALASPYDNHELFYAGVATEVLVGILNSPGSSVNTPITAWPFRWLSPNQPFYLFLTGSTSTYTVPANSPGIVFGDNAPSITGLGWHGIRFNCELVWDGTPTSRQNLQTFLTIQKEVGEGAAAKSQPRSMLPAEPDKKAMEAHLDRSEATRLRTSVRRR